jgi:hypothetical protein
VDCCWKFQEEAVAACSDVPYYHLPGAVRSAEETYVWNSTKSYSKLELNGLCGKRWHGDDYKRHAINSSSFFYLISIIRASGKPDFLRNVSLP